MYMHKLMCLSSDPPSALRSCVVMLRAGSHLARDASLVTLRS